MEKIVPIFVKPLKFSEDFDKKKNKNRTKTGQVLCIMFIFVICCSC